MSLISSFVSLCFLLLRSTAMEFSILLLCLAVVIAAQYLNLRGQPIVKWPILGHLPALLHNLHHLNDWMWKTLKDLGCGTFIFKGPIFTRMEIVCTCNPQNVDYMMKKNFTNFHKGPHFAEIFDFLGDGMFIADGESWATQRKMALPRFMSKRFQSFYMEKSHEVVMNGLLPVLQHVVDSKGTSTLDLQEVFKRLAFDATCASVLGRNPGFLSVGFCMENGFSKALDTVTRVAFRRHFVPSFFWKMMRLLRVGWERQYNLAWQVIDDQLTQYISTKKQDLADGITSDDLLSTYIRSKEDEEEKQEENSNMACTETFLRDTTLTFIFAGLDTVSSGLTWFFWLLSKSPSIEEKIIEELKLFMMSKEQVIIAKKNNAPILLSSLDEVTKLIYLEAAILESMRLYPPVPLEHKCAKEEDVLPDGTTVRPGVIIFYSLYAMGRMEWIWGEDSLDFKPERWIDEKGNLKHESASRYPVFNVGPRACLGKRMALNIMKMTIAAILLNFHFQVVEGQSSSLAPSVILKMEKGLKVTVANRNELF